MTTKFKHKEVPNVIFNSELNYDEILLTVVPRDGQISFNDFKSRLNTEYNLSLNKVNKIIQRCQELIDD